MANTGVDLTEQIVRLLTGVVDAEDFFDEESIETVAFLAVVAGAPDLAARANAVLEREVELAELSAHQMLEEARAAFASPLREHVEERRQFEQDHGGWLAQRRAAARELWPDVPAEALEAIVRVPPPRVVWFDQASAEEKAALERHFRAVAEARRNTASTSPPREVRQHAATVMVGDEAVRIEWRAGEVAHPWHARD